VCQEGRRHVDAQTAEEEKAAGAVNGEKQEEAVRDIQKENPLDVLHKRAKDGTLTQSRLQDGERKVSKDREDEHDSKEDLEAVQVKSVDGRGKTKENIVQERQRGGNSNAVVREHVCIQMVRS
jgi:hypothetical protein